MAKKRKMGASKKHKKLSKKGRCSSKKGKNSKVKKLIKLAKSRNKKQIKKKGFF